MGSPVPSIPAPLFRVPQAMVVPLPALPEVPPSPDLAGWEHIAW